jgi:hypothetical protein
MRPCWVAAALGLLALLLLVAPVVAGRRWCARDPIVAVNGTQLQIWVAIPEEYLPFVNGPIQTTVLTPADVTREVIYLDEGFNGYGEVVVWGDLYAPPCRNGACVQASVASDGSFDVQVTAVVPLERTARLRAMPLQLTIVFEDGSSRVIETRGNSATIRVTVQGT